ncbi:MAG: hypothetical protein ABSA16_14565 [Thermoguttaceae bacterium]
MPGDFLLGFLLVGRKRGNQFVAQLRAEPLEQIDGVFNLLIDG